jgi:hypothetical protein
MVQIVAALPINDADGRAAEMFAHRLLRNAVGSP